MNRAALALAAILLAFPALADRPERWDNEGYGTMDLPAVGQANYTVSYSSIGYDHFLTSIVIEWMNGDDPVSQELYFGAHDNPPATLVPTDDGINLHLEFCQRQQDICEMTELRFRYDQSDGLFHEV